MTHAERALLLAVAKRMPTKWQEVYEIGDLIAAVEAEAVPDVDFKRAGEAAVEFLNENPTLLAEVGEMLDGASCTHRRADRQGEE